MADIFVSYARSSEAEARLVADALTTLGYQVWRDDSLPAHRAYGEVIEEQLRTARAVIVLWSAEAAKSHWVRAEADVARNAGTLVQLSLDGTVPPLPFNQIQCATLQGWSGDTGAPGWQTACASVVDLAGPPPRRQRGSTRQRHANERSICVLPFANMSGDIEQEYFSDGISEDITTDLSKISALAVTARNTAFQFKGQSVDVTEVARKLGVSHVVEGSVRKAGGRVRITAQLIDGATGDHVWAERWDRDLTDIFAIQDEISQAIVAALKLKLMPAEKRAIEQRGTANVEAYNLYLMAHQYWITGNYGDARRDEIVIRFARRAIELDADYARAWALVAIAEAGLRHRHGRPDVDGLAAAETALGLDPGLAEPYCVTARELAEQGDLAAANAEIAKGLALDPESWEVNREAARLCMTERRIADAAGYFAKAAALAENDFHSCAMLSTCFHALGQIDDERAVARTMIERAERVVTQDPANAAALGVSAVGLATLGEVDRGRERLDRAMLIDPDNINMPYNFGCALASRIGDLEGALDLIGPTFTTASRSLIITALADPDLDPLRDHPRFKAIAAAAMARTGIDPREVASPGSAARLRS